MFGNFSNIRNTHCNTDSFGLRYNNLDNEKNYKNIKVINGDSKNVLKNILPKINGRCLFWLDGH